MWFDKWNRETLEYLGRVNVEAEEEKNINNIYHYKFEKVITPSYPAEDLEPGFYKIQYDNKQIYIVEKKKDAYPGDYYSNVVYDVNGKKMDNPHFPSEYLNFASGFVKILKRVILKEGE